VGGSCTEPKSLYLPASIPHAVQARYTATDGRAVDCTAARACVVRVSAGPLYTIEFPLELAAATQPASPTPSTDAAAPAAGTSSAKTRPAESSARGRRDTQAEPRTRDASDDADGGTRWWPWLVGAAVVLLLAAGGGWWWYRRRASIDPPADGPPDEPRDAPPPEPRIPTAV
jgi:hypothetical protein